MVDIGIEPGIHRFGAFLKHLEHSQVGRQHIGFEPLEVYRTLLDYAHENVRVVMNDRPLYPLAALQKQVAYPDRGRLISRIRSLAAELRIIKGTELAITAGHSQAQNVVLVGAFAGLNWIAIEKEKYMKSIKEIFSGEKLDINKKAFELGYQAVIGQ